MLIKLMRLLHMSAVVKLLVSNGSMCGRVACSEEVNKKADHNNGRRRADPQNHLG